MIAGKTLMDFESDLWISSCGEQRLLANATKIRRVILTNAQKMSSDRRTYYSQMLFAFDSFLPWFSIRHWVFLIQT
jgi:hypothetical protein